MDRLPLVTLSVASSSDGMIVWSDHPVIDSTKALPSLLFELLHPFSKFILGLTCIQVPWMGESSAKDLSLLVPLMGSTFIVVSSSRDLSSVSINILMPRTLIYLMPISATLETSLRHPPILKIIPYVIKLNKSLLYTYLGIFHWKIRMVRKNKNERKDESIRLIGRRSRHRPS